MSDDLSRAMRATAEGLTPNISKLTSGGVERGLRKRRVRRISQITGAAASVTAVFGVVAAVGTGGTGHGTGPASAAAGGTPAAVAATTPAAKPTTPASAPTTQPKPSNTPFEAVPPQAVPSAPPVSGEDMVKVLKDQVAPLKFTNVTVTGKEGSNEGGAAVALKVGFAAGTGSISADVNTNNWRNQSLGDTLPPYITVRNQPDGSHIMIYNGPEWPAGNGDPSAKRLDVTWYRNDGVTITIEGLNEAFEKQSTTASAVPLTVDQAIQIATSPAWDKAAAAAAYQGYVNYQEAMKRNSTATPGNPEKPGDKAKPAQSSGH